MPHFTKRHLFNESPEATNFRIRLSKSLNSLFAEFGENIFVNDFTWNDFLDHFSGFIGYQATSRMKDNSKDGYFISNSKTNEKIKCKNQILTKINLCHFADVGSPNLGRT